MMRRFGCLAVLGAIVAMPAFTALKPGSPPADFHPAAFMTGCTIEARDFADAMDACHALGSAVIVNPENHVENTLAALRKRPAHAFHEVRSRVLPAEIVST